MSIKNFVSVKTQYTRSINLERDANSSDVVSSYIPTSRALRTFARIADSFNLDLQPRAWSLVGPYGSGKSAFAVFLSQLLSTPTSNESHVAQQVLGKSEKTLATKFAKDANDSDGYLKVLITGSPESLSKRLVSELAEVAESYWKNIPGKKPSIIEELKNASSGDATTSEIIELIKQLQVRLERTRCKGILFVIDELGKFLEYEARHYGANDIYLLQALAEHACKGHEANLFLFVLLHQSFEQYAKGLGENLKTEWSKVQGRFEEVPFLESAEQVLRVVSAAFKYDLNRSDREKLLLHATSVAKVLVKEQAIPSTLELKEAASLFANCYPLHPVSAVILPILCQKIAQNERTLFSYLGSQEEFGLTHMLDVLTDLDDAIYPHHIFDYFIQNQPAVLGDHLTHRRWVEVVTALERLGDAPIDEINLLKTIGMLNIIGSRGGLKASKAILKTCLSKHGSPNLVIKSLVDKSIISYRKFNSEYRVWQGSDFDLEAALQEEINNVGNFSLAEELNKSKGLLPIVARKYTIQNGTLRYFTPIFADAKNFRSLAETDNEARIVLYLASAQDDERIFHAEVVNAFSSLDVVALCKNSEYLKEAVNEALALSRVGATRQELNNDPVAKREFNDRYTAAKNAEDQLLQRLVESPEDNLWYYNSAVIEIKSKRQLQERFSSVLESVYDKSPKIFNELINRDKPSSQANAARNKLLYAMQQHATKSDLGIDKFPPEKAIYRSVLREAKLHQLDDDGVSWCLTAPSSDGRIDRSNIRHVWNCIDEFLDSTEKQAKSLASLNKVLMAPPYGVKAGLLPILYVTTYLVNQHELALYEQRRYKPYFTEDMLERFVKRPDEYEFQRFRISGLRASIFEQYSRVIHGDKKQRTLLELAKPLASFMGGLPEYTHKTRRGISEQAIKIRIVFNLAKSPEALLFEELPQALGYGAVSSMHDDHALESFSQALIDVLRELKNAYESLKNRQKELLAQAFNIDRHLPVEELRKILAGNCHGLENYTVDTQGLRAFIMRLTKSSGTTDEWFENILMFLGNKPSKNWQDSDQDIAEYRLNDFSRRLIDLEKLRLHEKDQAARISGDFDVYLLRSIKKGGDIQDEVVAINQDSSKQIAYAKEKIQISLNELPDKELRLGALAELVDEFLHDYKQQQSQAKTKPDLSGTKLVKGGKG